MFIQPFILREQFKCATQQTKNMKLKYQPERTEGAANKEGTVLTYTLTDIEPYTAKGDSRLSGFYAKVVERENAWRLFRADRIVELGA